MENNEAKHHGEGSDLKQTSLPTYYGQTP